MKKRGIAQEYITAILIALAFLGVMFLAIMIMKEGGISWIDKIKSFLKF